jgi:uncharacterized protein (DUF433 family)
MATEIYPGVTVDTQVIHGKPAIRGTRIPVSLVLGQLAGGVTFEEIQREYGLTAEQVQAALGYEAQRYSSTSQPRARACSRAC